MGQFLKIVLLNFRLLIAHPAPGLISLIGMVGLTAVIASLLVIADAFQHALAGTGEPDRALILRQGSTAEINGNIPLSQFPLISEHSDIQSNGDTKLASRETFVTVNLAQTKSGQSATAPLRGVVPTSFDVRPEVEIISGRRFTPGKFELIAGIKAAEVFIGLVPGKTISIRGEQWLVTGLFSANNGAYESEIWADERLLAQINGRGNTFSSMLVQLESPDHFAAFKSEIENDRRLTVSAHRESEYYQRQVASTHTLISAIGGLVGSIMAFGALIAAFNTMQTSLHHRSRELATLRALGYQRVPLFLGLLFESLTLTLSGAALAILAIYIMLDGNVMSTVAATTTSTSQLAFEFSLNPKTILVAISIASVLGVLGSLGPAFKAVRCDLPQALKGFS